MLDDLLYELREKQKHLKSEYRDLSSDTVSFLRTIKGKGSKTLKIGKFKIKEVWDCSETYYEYFCVFHKKDLLLKHEYDNFYINLDRLEDLIIFKSLITDYMQENEEVKKLLKKYEKAEEFKKLWKEVE